MDAYAPGNKIGVTIKVPESKRYAGDNPWFVFEGGSPESLKAKIAETFGLQHEGLTLGETVINAQRHVTGLGAVAHGFGGTILSGSSTEPESKPADGFPSTTDDVWSKVSMESKPEPEGEAEKDPILVALDNCKTVAEVQQIWAENQASFNANAEYMEAYKARGKALSK